MPATRRAAPARRAAASSSADPAARLEDVLAHLRKHEARHVEELAQFVRIPSVGADPAHGKDVRRAAQWLAKRLRKAGLENVALVETSGHPAVVADWLHAGPAAPTVLVYGHYDVQPASKSDGWAHDPFGGDVADGRLFGRGATDDKGQLLCHVLAAEAWLATGRPAGPPVNLRFVVEGEEESGSLHFPEVIAAARDRLAADVLLVSDSPMAGEGRPSIVHSLRGLAYLQIDLHGPRGDLHSGTWGGVLWNPLEALAHVLASFKDPRTGRVLVKGFYDGVAKPGRRERADLAAHGENEAALAATAGIPEDALFGEVGWSAQERIGLRPTFEVHGLWGGYQGAGSKTVIPAHAHAKVSCRLVAGQDPEAVRRLVEAHVRRHVPKGIRAEVHWLNGGHPVRADPGHPAVRAVARALGEAFGRPAVFLPEGGSIPAVADLQRTLGAVPVLAGFGNRDENMHAPEESFRLSSFFKGREACARALLHLAGSA